MIGARPPAAPPGRGGVGIFTSGLWRLRDEVAEMTGLTPSRRFFAARGLAAVAGWGFKPTARRARGLAARSGLPYYAIEDGFFRSLRPGRDAPSLSYVCDPVGVYYDASRPSALEAHVAARARDPEGARRDAAPVLAALRDLGLSKYNAFADPPGALDALAEDREENVLVVDQTWGDAAVAGAGADPARFAAMAAAAAVENPGRRIVIRSHPDARLRGRRSHFSDALLDAAADASPALGAARAEGRLLRLEADVTPARLLRRVGRVYAVSSLMGFEALAHGAQVVCFGAAFYAGWGLTDDRFPPIARRGSASLEALTAAAFLDYSVYFTPGARRRTDVLDAIDRLAADRAALRG